MTGAEVGTAAGITAGIAAGITAGIATAIAGLLAGEYFFILPWMHRQINQPVKTRARHRERRKVPGEERNAPRSSNNA